MTWPLSTTMARHFSASRSTAASPMCRNSGHMRMAALSAAFALNVAMIRLR